LEETMTILDILNGVQIVAFLTALVLMATLLLYVKGWLPRKGEEG